jgi:hypothetical protein
MTAQHDYTAFGESPDHTQINEAQLRQRVQQLEDEIAGLKSFVTVNALLHSSWDLLERFDAHPTPKKALDRFGSEVFEFAAAAFEAWGGSGMEHAHAAKECADVMVTALNVMRSLKIPRLLILTTIAAVMKENDDKDNTTHQRSADHGVEKKHRE